MEPGVTDMIKAEIIGADKVLANMAGIFPRVRAAAKRSITRSLLELVAEVKSNKLSGQVLRNRTGRLRRSIHSSGVKDSGSEISGVVGTNVEYAAAHEYGFTGTVTVKAHMRITKASMKAAMGFKGLKKSERLTYARSSGAGGATVKSHSRKVNIPERSFLRSALKEMAPGFIARLQADINEVLTK